MPRLNNFIKDFQKNHSKLLGLISSFRKTMESLHLPKARKILDEIDTITNGHFNFEEIYLYPRLRRLVLETTQNLHKEQQTTRGFISKSRGLLEKNKLTRFEISNILDMVSRLSKLFKDCDNLVFLVDKFNERDKKDLNKRFRDCCKTKRLVTA